MENITVSMKIMCKYNMPIAEFEKNLKCLGLRSGLMLGEKMLPFELEMN